jgi:hypothetical protein
VADPALAAEFTAWSQYLRKGLDAILQHAADRGDLPPDVDAELVNDLLLGAHVHQVRTDSRPGDSACPDADTGAVTDGVYVE